MENSYRITPLLKSEDLTNVSNYRLISVLHAPVPDKVLETLIHNALSSLLEDNSIFTSRQGGYQKEISMMLFHK